MTEHPESDRPSAELIESLKRSVTVSAGFEARVMAQVRRSRTGFGRGVLLAAGIAGLSLLGAAALALRPDHKAVAAEVTFEVHAPDAKSVVLVGDFNDWDVTATPLTRADTGAWQVRLPLRPGNYSYAFLVDGDRWMPDPVAPQAAVDDFGRPNSLITIAGSL